MPRQVLEKIKEAEKKAETVIEGGRKEKERMSGEAEKEAKEIIAKSQEEARKEGEKIKKRLLHEAEEEIKQIGKEFEMKRKKIGENSKKNLKEVVQFIAQRAKKFWVES